MFVGAGVRDPEITLHGVRHVTVISIIVSGTR